MAEVRKKGKSGTHKYGRNKEMPAKQRYTNERRWVKNKVRKAQKHANKTMFPVSIKIDGQWLTVLPMQAKIINRAA